MQNKPAAEWLTFPNIITCARILFSVWLLFVILNYSYYSDYAKNAQWWFALIALTDLLDGHIARRTNSVSHLGEIIDPMADKISVLPLLWYSSITGAISLWFPVLITAREIIVLYYRGVARGMKERTPALLWGKVKACLEYAAIFVLLALQFDMASFGFIAVADPKIVSHLLMLSLIASLCSIWQYKQHYDFLMKKKRRGSGVT